MYDLSASAEGDCYRCVPPDPGIEAAALGASESVLPGTSPAEALHTFTLDLGASRCFFRDNITLTPLPAPVPVRLADPSGSPVVAHSSTVLRCLAVPSGSLSGLHLPLFSTNLVSTAALQDAMVTTTTPGGQRVSICTCTRTGRHLATFTRRPGSSLYTLATEPPHVAASAQVFASGPVAPPCSCRLLSHQTLLWHHRLGHPSLPRLRGMHSRLLVSGLPRSLPPSRPRLPRPAFLVSRGGSAPLLTPPRFPLRLLPCRVSTWTFRLQLQERFCADLPGLRLHSDRGGEFSSDLLRNFCRGEGILQLFTLADSPQQNGIAERRIGLVMEVARTSMIHADAPHFLWTFAVWYAAHQLNLCPRVSFPETSPTLRWTGKVDPLPGTAPVEVAVGSGGARGAASGGAMPGVAESEGAGSWGAEPVGEEPGGAEPAGVEPGGVEPGCAELEGAESGGAEPQGGASCGDPAGASPSLSPQQQREWLVWRARLWSGATGAGGAGAARAGGAGVTAGAGAGGAGAGGIGARGAGAGGARVGGIGVGGARAGGTGAGGAGVGGTGAGGTGAGGAGAVDPGGTLRTRPYFVPLHQQLLAPASPLPTPSPYTEQSGGLTERREPASRPVLPVRTARLVPHSRPPPVPGTHAMALRPSSVPLRVPLTAPPDSSLSKVPNPESDCARAASPTVSRLLSTAVIDPSFESAAASALVAELLDIAAACRLDHATTLVADSASACPPSVGGECALGTDVLEDRQEEFECLAAAVPRFTSMLLARTHQTSRPHALTQRRLRAPRKWHDTLRTTLAALGFAPSVAVSTHRHLAAAVLRRRPCADSEAMTLVKSELQKRYTCTDLGELHNYLGLQITRDRARGTIKLTQSHMVHQVLQRFGFQFSSPQPTPLSTGHSLSDPPSDESVEPSGPYPELVGCLMYMMTCTRPDLAYPLKLLARYVAPSRHRK
ncbi:unnamed protein product, partial [Closterium sp. NIES-54]